MLTSILVPLDGSANSEAVLTQVRRLLLAEDACVLLLHVVEVRREEDGREVLGDVGRAREALRELRDRWRDEGVRAEMEVRSGDPARRILETARERGIGLIAMSTHGRTGWSRALRGSVAERVVRHSRTPVLLVRSPGEGPPPAVPAGARFRRILVPLDGSETSALVLPLVESLARAFSSEVVLEHASLEVAWPPFEPKPLTWIAGGGQERLEPFRRRLAEAGIPCRTRIDRSVPVQAILEAAAEEDADLVAMTTHGRSGPSRWLLGSVAESVLHQTARPLLLVRPTGPRARVGTNDLVRELQVRT